MRKELKATLVVMVIGGLSLLISVTHTSISGRINPEAFPESTLSDGQMISHTKQGIHSKVADSSLLINNSLLVILQPGVKMAKPTLLPHKPPSRFKMPRLFWVRRNRFGNQLFQYSSAYCLAVTTDHLPTIAASSVLLKIFSNITGDVTVHGPDFYSPRQYELFAGAKRFDRFCCKYDEQAVEWMRHNPWEVLINGYRESFKYFLPCWDRLKHQLTLQQPIRKEAFSHVTRLLQEHFRRKGSGSEFVEFSLSEEQWETGLPRPYTYIGVHVRRTDKKGMYAPLVFFDEAIQYYVKKYERPVFLVCSDDIDWCREQMTARYWFTDMVFVSHQSVSHFVDFASLVSCDHSVITSGTFGWWSAWLAGGEVLYYKAFDKVQRHFGWQYKQEDYYPPHWKPIL